MFSKFQKSFFALALLSTLCLNLLAQSDTTEPVEFGNGNESFLYDEYVNVIDLTKIIVPADSAKKYLVSYFYEPYPQKVGESILQLGGSFTPLPIPVMENEYPAPALDLQYKLGLFEKNSLNPFLSTNIFSNLLHTGIQWNKNSNRFSFGFANHNRLLLWIL